MGALSLMERAGVMVPENLPDNRIETVFEATGLNWTIEQKPLYSDYGEIPKLVANYRSDTHDFLGTVSPTKYKIVSNLEAFNFIDELPNFTLEKVGMFDNGKKVFVVGKSQEQIDIDKHGDIVNFYLTFLHGHDGKSGIRFIICPIRMFCMNQLNMMMRTASFKYSITHVGEVEMKLNEIQKAIANSQDYTAELAISIDTMINTKANMPIEKFVDALIVDKDDDNDRTINRNAEIRHEIVSLYNNKNDLANYKGTSFGYISAVSDYLSHREPLRRSSNGSTDGNMFIDSLEGHRFLEDARQILGVA